MFITLWDLKQPTRYSQRVGHGVPAVVARPHFNHSWFGWDCQWTDSGCQRRLYMLRPGARFSKVPALFGRISGYIVSSKPRCLEARNFALILILIPFTTYENPNFAESADRSFTNGFSGPKSLRDFPGLPRGSIACKNAHSNMHLGNALYKIHNHYQIRSPPDGASISHTSHWSQPFPE